MGDGERAGSGTGGAVGCSTDELVGDLLTEAHGEAYGEALDFGMDAEPARQSPAAPADPIHGGIDPGKKGAAAILLPSGPRAWRTPVLADGKTYDLVAVVRLMHKWKALGVTHVMLERQVPSHKAGTGRNTGASSAFKIGYGYAMWEVALVAAGISYTVVMPSAWKKAMRIQAPSTVKKEARPKWSKAKAVQECQQAYPEHDLRWNPNHPSSKPSPDQAEAILLAKYGRKINAA